jgi:hypothetical protein
MEYETILSLYSWAPDLYKNVELFFFNHYTVQADNDLQGMKELLEQGIMTQSDIDIILADNSVIIADIEDIINGGHDNGLSKREIVKKLLICLIRKHKLSTKYVQFIIKQLDKSL